MPPYKRSTLHSSYKNPDAFKSKDTMIAPDSLTGLTSRCGFIVFGGHLRDIVASDGVSILRRFRNKNISAFEYEAIKSFVCTWRCSKRCRRKADNPV